MATSTVDALKQAIAALPKDEQVKLACWLNSETMDDWDREMQRDFSPGGRGYHLIAEIEREVATGQPRPIEEGFAMPRRESRSA